MCVIMYSPPGVAAPPTDHLIAANEENPHGWGAAINIPRACGKHNQGVVSGTCKKCRNLSEIKIMRGFDTYELLEAVRVLDIIRDHTETEGGPLASLVVHCRIATGGEISLRNTHPFEVTPKTLLFHNGIFSETTIPTKADPKRPDSYHLARLIQPVLEPAPWWAQSPAFTEWLDNLCSQGCPNKVALLDAVYGAILYNRTAWVDGEEGRLYSNDGPLWGSRVPYGSFDWEDKKDIPLFPYGLQEEEKFFTWKDYGLSRKVKGLLSY